MVGSSATGALPRLGSHWFVRGGYRPSSTPLYSTPAVVTVRASWLPKPGRVDIVLRRDIGRRVQHLPPGQNGLGDRRPGVPAVQRGDHRGDRGVVSLAAQHPVRNGLERRPGRGKLALVQHPKPPGYEPTTSRRIKMHGTAGSAAAASESMYSSGARTISRSVTTAAISAPRSGSFHLASISSFLSDVLSSGRTTSLTLSSNSMAALVYAGVARARTPWRPPAAEA